MASICDSTSSGASDCNDKFIAPIMMKGINPLGDLGLYKYIMESSYMQALWDIQNLVNLSAIMRLQQPMTYQVLNILGFCTCCNVPELGLGSHFNVDHYGAASTSETRALLHSSLTFPSFERQTNTQSTFLHKIESKKEVKIEVEPEKHSEESQPKEEGPHSTGETSEPDSDEEAKDDNYLLQNHPYEIKYIHNKKTNRKLKRMVCKYEGCDKVFEKKWNFKDHIRMHMGETPYKCRECNKSFTQRGNLVKHERQHTFKNLKARKIHKCSICTKAFTEKYNLKVSPISLDFDLSQHFMGV